MEHRGYVIRVELVPSVSGGTYHATYSIHRNGELACCGTVAGGLTTPADAEREAYAAARRWIDQQG